MSLSFPLLISAVPLHALDMTRTRTREAVGAIEDGHAPADPPVAEVCWFSDGGIASNFPVHFFDTPLPTRPTFAIDLDGFHPDHPRRPDQEANVYLPSSNVGGLLDSWHRLDPNPGLGSLSGFVSGIVRTMQNHVDPALTHQPGYRDRIVHVHTAPDEGGMNLTMPPEVITALTLRGQAAGRALVERFAETPGTEPGLSWDNHRWVRYRSTLTALAEQLEALAQAWRAEPDGGRSYRELVDRGGDVGPSGYRFASDAQRALALGLTELLAKAGERSEEAEAASTAARLARSPSRGSCPATEPARRLHRERCPTEVGHTPCARALQPVSDSGRAPRLPLDAGRPESGPDVRDRRADVVVGHGEAVVRASASREDSAHDVPVLVHDRPARVPAADVAAKGDDRPSELDAPVCVAGTDPCSAPHPHRGDA